MASGLYDLGRQAFLDADIDWTADNIKAVLVKTSGGYTVNLATDQFLSAIASGDRVATSGNLSSKTSSNGIADAADITWPAVTGTQVGAIVLYKDTGNAATSPLIAYLDSAAITGLPLTPSGADITVIWDAGANKIFKL